ncbi:MAG: glycosyltransferase [Methanobacteriota archaeon]|nr:MAG: glycosyltransferase [Euryarchaeota archaeon]
MLLNPSAPQIPNIENGNVRPLWSVMIPTYNCADYLRIALESVLEQDLGPDVMQIEVVDDCSRQDDPEAIVKEIGQGRVNFFRQVHNVGAIANFNTCIQRSIGYIVHILHGDDLVKPGFYQKLGPPLLENEHIGAAFCRQIYIDENGRETVVTRCEQPYTGIFERALDTLAVSNRIQPPSMVVKRSVYETLGGFDPRLFHAADWEMWVRIATSLAIWYEVEPLAYYRIHSASDTSKLVRTGANIQNRREAINVFSRYLPPDRKPYLMRKALGYSAIYGFKMTIKALKMQDFAAGYSQLRETLLCLQEVLHN